MHSPLTHTLPRAPLPVLLACTRAFVHLHSPPCPSTHTHVHTCTCMHPPPPFHVLQFIHACIHMHTCTHTHTPCPSSPGPPSSCVWSLPETFAARCHAVKIVGSGISFFSSHVLPFYPFFVTLSFFSSLSLSPPFLACRRGGVVWLWFQSRVLLWAGSKAGLWPVPGARGPGPPAPRRLDRRPPAWWQVKPPLVPGGLLRGTALGPPFHSARAQRGATKIRRCPPPTTVTPRSQHGEAPAACVWQPMWRVWGSFDPHADPASATKKVKIN
jgi:hypothetical protein